MPQEAEDLAEDMIFRFIEEQEELERLQKRAIEQATLIQHLPKSQLNKFGPTAIRSRMIALNRDVLEFYRRDFDGIYLAGARSVDPTFTIGPLERKRLALMNTNEYLKIRRAAENAVRDSKRFIEMVWNDRVDRRKRLGTLHNHVDFVNARALPQNIKSLTPQGILRILVHPSVAKDNSEQTIRLRGIKAVVYRNGRRHTLGNYGSMVMRTGASNAYNMGKLDAMQRKGIEWVVVSDGPECGWTYHDDPNTANGQVVSLDEARANPLAHPNCKRTFSPASPQQIKDEEVRRGRQAKREQKQRGKRAQKAAETAALGLALGLGTAYAAAGLSNLVAAGAERYIGSEAFNSLLERLAVRSFHGDKVSRWFSQRLSYVAGEFRGSPLASVTEIYPGGPVNLPSLPLWDHVRYFADGFAEGTGLKNIPSEVRRGLGLADDAIEQALGDRFQTFYSAAKKAAMSEDFGDNIRNVIDMEARRRGMFTRILDDLPGKPEIRAAWTRWGPRARVDITEWMRAKTTFTPTGAINTLAVNASGQLRGVFKIYQDGLMGGHISALPKNFLNGIVRAIVEIDERGHLVGNLRLVPGGPLRLRLEFKTDAVVQDLRDFSISPLGALGNIAEQFRKFSFDRAVLELRIFNQNIFEVAGNLRLPIEDVRRMFRAAREVGDIAVAAGEGRFTGTLKYFSRNPEFVKKIFGDSKATLFGNIRFSSLTQQALRESPTLRLLNSLNTRFLTRAHLTAEGLQDIATNMKIHGWSIYDIGNVLKLRWNQVQELVRNGLPRLERIAQDWGVIGGAVNVLPHWTDRLGAASQYVGRLQEFRDRNLRPNMADIVSKSMSIFDRTPGKARPMVVKAFVSLANIEQTDTEERMFLKIRALVTFLRTHGRIEGTYLSGFDQSLDDITDQSIRALAVYLRRRATSGLSLV